MQYLNEIKFRIFNLHTQLLVLSGRTQAEASCTVTMGSGKRSHSHMTTDSDYEQDRGKLPKQLQSGTLGVVEDKEELLRLGARIIDDITALKEGHQSVLQDFSTSLEGSLKTAEIFNGKPCKKTYKDSLCTFGELSADNPVPIPGPLAEEVAYAQPYLLALLQALASVVDNVDLANPNSPGKTLIQQNRIVPPTRFRKKRVADKSIAANSRFIFLLRDDTVEIPVEEKPGERKGASPEDLLHEHTDQILSTLAKQVGIAFNFSGTFPTAVELF
jgi:hypothetical protein